MVERPAQAIRGSQIILLGMMAGVLAITSVAVYVRLTTEMPISADAAHLLPVAVVVLFFSAAPAYVLIRRNFLARASAEKDAALELVQKNLMPPQLGALAIIGAALAEGVGLLGAVTLLIGGPWLVLAAPAIALFLIAVQIPTRARVETLVRELQG